ncbi:MAG: TonB-dependent receptor, partial [Caldilineaceae bacterium]|nr:TonB-dependent receptor [Caldilineaceae bacterium]
RWQRPLTAASDMSLQLYYDRAQRAEDFVGQQHDTLDLEFQHRSQVGVRHRLVWGLGYRQVATRVDLSPIISADSDRFRLESWNAFAQDEISLWDERLRLTLGLKVEDNDFSGLEYQPAVRTLWKFSEHASVWGAVSRAVRAPSIMERHSALRAATLAPGTASPPIPLPVVLEAGGNPRFDSEYLVAYEAGLRSRPFERLALDVAVYYNDYDDLRTVDGDSFRIAPDGSHAIVSTAFNNNAEGDAYGAEIGADWLVRDGWRLIGAYSYIDLRLRSANNRVNVGSGTVERNAPERQLSLRSQHTLAEDVAVDLWLRYVDDSASAALNQRVIETIDAYWDLDLRLAWLPRPDVELELVAQNLLDGARFEGDMEALTTTQVEVQRAVYAALRLRF